MAPKSYFFCLFFLIFGVGCVAPHTSTGPAGNNSMETLRVGITPNAPPMAYRENGKITGLEVELARGLAKRINKDLRFVELDWEDQIPALLAGKIDIIMSAMTVTDARKYQITFTDPYMVTGQVSLVRLSEQNKFSDGLPSLLSPLVRVGTVKATTGYFLVAQSKAKGDIIEYPDAEAGVKALLANKIDVFVYDLPMNFYLGAKYANRALTPVTVPMSREYIAWGVRRDDSELLHQANSYLEEIRDAGKLKEMIIRWIPFYERLFNK